MSSFFLKVVLYSVIQIPAFLVADVESVMNEVETALRALDHQDVQLRRALEVMGNTLTQQQSRLDAMAARADRELQESTRRFDALLASLTSVKSDTDLKIVSIVTAVKDLQDTNQRLVSTVTALTDPGVVGASGSSSSATAAPKGKGGKTPSTGWPSQPSLESNLLKSLRLESFGSGSYVGRVGWRLWMPRLQAYWNLYCTSLHPTALKMAERRGAVGCDADFYRAIETVSPGGLEHSAALHTLLVHSTTGAASTVVISNSGCCGLESLRRLSFFADPTLGGEQHLIKMYETLQVISAEKATGFAEAVSEWEASVAEYDLMAREEFPESQKQVSLERFAVARDRSLQAHIALHREQFVGYNELRNFLIRFFTSKTSSTAMDVSAVGETFTGTCHFCQKVGHRERDCRRKAAGLPQVPATGAASSSSPSYSSSPSSSSSWWSSSWDAGKGKGKGGGGGGGGGGAGGKGSGGKGGKGFGKGSGKKEKGKLKGSKGKGKKGKEKYIHEVAEDSCEVGEGWESEECGWWEQEDDAWREGDWQWSDFTTQISSSAPPVASTATPSLPHPSLNVHSLYINMVQFQQQPAEQLLYKVHRPIFGWESELPTGYVSVMCDSGACLSACPRNFAVNEGLSLPTRFPNAEFLAANGSRIQAENSRLVNLVCMTTSKSNLDVGIRFESCDVHRPILSVGEITAKKHVFVLASPRARLVLRDQQEIPLLAAGGTFYLICRLSSPSSAAQDFH